MVGQAISGLKYFNLYLKWDGWSVVDINILPTGGDALSVVAALFFGILADQTGWNATLVVLLQGIVITSNSMLAAWCSGHDLSKGSLLFAYYLSYVGLAAQPIVIVSTYHVPPVPVTRRVIISPSPFSPQTNKKPAIKPRMCISFSNVFISKINFLAIYYSPGATISQPAIPFSAKCSWRAGM